MANMKRLEEWVWLCTALYCFPFIVVMKALRVFFAVRQLYHKLTKHVDQHMPLTPPTNSASCGDLVDLSMLCCHGNEYFTAVSPQTITTCCRVQLQ